MLSSPHHCTPYIIALFSTSNLPPQVQQMHKIVAQNMNSYSNWKFECDLKFEWRRERRQLFRLMQQVLTVTHFRKSRWNCYGFNSIYHGKWYHHFSIFYLIWRCTFGTIFIVSFVSREDERHLLFATDLGCNNSNERPRTLKEWWEKSVQEHFNSLEL